MAGELAERAFEAIKRYVFTVKARDVNDPEEQWTPEALMYRRVLLRHFPSTVYTCDRDQATFIWLARGAPTRQWRLVEATALPPQIPADVAPGSSAAYPTGPLVLWMSRFPPLNGLDAFCPKLAWMVTVALRVEVDEAVADYRSRVGQVYTGIGTRSLTLRPEEPPPRAHPNIQIVGRWEQGRVRRLSYADVVKVVEHCVPLLCVPEDVAFVLQRCLRLFLAGYQEWDFFTVSEHYAGMALETSLRTLYYRCFTYPAHLQWRDHDTVVESITLQSPSRGWMRYRGSHVSWDGSPLKPFLNGIALDTRKGSLLSWARRHQWLSPGEIWQGQSLFELRDYMSHPDGPHVDWYGWAAKQVQTSAWLINSMWSRYTHPDIVPWDGEFWSQPKWAPK